MTALFFWGLGKLCVISPTLVISKCQLFFFSPTLVNVNGQRSFFESAPDDFIGRSAQLSFLLEYDGNPKANVVPACLLVCPSAATTVFAK
jgi:hypothetical protein